MFLLLLRFVHSVLSVVLDHATFVNYFRSLRHLFVDVCLDLFEWRLSLQVFRVRSQIHQGFTLIITALLLVHSTHRLKTTFDVMVVESTVSRNASMYQHSIQCLLAAYLAPQSLFYRCVAQYIDSIARLTYFGCCSNDSRTSTTMIGRCLSDAHSTVILFGLVSLSQLIFSLHTNMVHNQSFPMASSLL